MKKTILLSATLACAVATGCGGKTKDKGTGMGSASGSSMASGMDMGSGSAMGSNDMSAGSGSAAGSAETKPAPPPPPPPAKTPDELAARYQECWGLWNDQKYDDFKSCYTADATSEDPGSGQPALSGADAIVEGSKQFRAGIPDLKGELQFVLVNGNHAVGVAIMNGTNSETMKTPMGDLKPSKKKVGFLFAHVAELDATAHVTHEWGFSDIPTLMGQIGASKMPGRKAMKTTGKAVEVVIAKGDDAETANVAVFQALVDAFNKHDPKALGDLLDKKLQWTDIAEPKDLDQKGAIADAKNFWKGFSDVKITPDPLWAAGAYVVMTGTMSGTNDGDMPAMHMKKTGKTFSSKFVHVVKVGGGKITNSWIFYDSMEMAMQLGMMPAPAAK